VGKKLKKKLIERDLNKRKNTLITSTRKQKG